LALSVSSRASNVVELLIWLKRWAIRWAIRWTVRSTLRRPAMRGVYWRRIATLRLPGTQLSWLACSTSLVGEVGKEVVTGEVGRWCPQLFAEGSTSGGSSSLCFGSSEDNHGICAGTFVA